MTDKHIIINIGRQFGCGGKAIADEISRKLGIPAYDGELLTEAAKKSGIRHELFKSSDEKFRFWNFGTGLTDQELYKIQSDTIRDIAQRGSAIFVGRAANYVLRDMDCLDVFISAPLEVRTQSIMERHHLSHKDAEALVVKSNKQRAEYYGFFTFSEWGDASNYDLCIDSSILGIQGTADFIIEFARRKGMLD